VLGPILFILYVADLATLVESHGLTPYQYADDTQIYGSCVNDVADWMQLMTPT